MGNASRYIHTHYANPFVVFSIHVFSSHDDKVSNRERKRKRGGHHKTAATQRLSFFLSIKLMSKDLMLHISEFHVQQYADKGGSPLSRKFT